MTGPVKTPLCSARPLIRILVPMRFTVRCNLLLLTVALATGCGSFRSKAATLGSDILASVRDRQPELFELERQLADSAGAFVGRAVEDKVLTRASGVWDTMLLKLNDQSRAAVGRVAQGVERDLNRSLQVMLSENLELADAKGRRIVTSILDDARGNLGPLVDTTMGSLAAGIRERLRPVLIDVLGEAADSVSKRIAALDRQLAESETGKGVSRLLWGLVIGLGVVVIGGGLAWRRSFTRNREAFQVTKSALESAPPFHREAVEQQLRDLGFHKQADWLRKGG